MNCQGLGTGTDGSDGLFLDGVSGTRPRRGKRPSNPQLRGTRGSRVRAVKGKRRPNGSARPASRPPCPAQSPRGRRGGKAAVSQSSRERSTTTTGAEPPTHGTAGPNRQTDKTVSPQSLGVGDRAGVKAPPSVTQPDPDPRSLTLGWAMCHLSLLTRARKERETLALEESWPNLDL